MRRLVIVWVAGGLLAGAAGGAHAQFRDPADPGAQVPGRPAPSFEPPERRSGVPERIDPALRFTARDRELFQAWAVAEYGKGKCPHGLVKKESQCLPRGQARKRYAIGRLLPPNVVPAPVPLDLTRRIGTPPIGYRYGMIDGDLVKLAVADGKAVDALDGFIPK
jgi:hypothetical protein